jgi:subtilisin family serine protease
MITVHGEMVVNGQYHIWLPLTGFVSPDVEFISPSNNYTVTIPGTSKNLITCGAYNFSDNCLYMRSSWGPSRINKISPDLAAPGVNVTGVSPSGFVKVNSTGAATAIAAGMSAIIMEWGIVLKHDTKMSTAQVRTQLIQRASRLPDIEYPNNQWGYGMLTL